MFFSTCCSWCCNHEHDFKLRKYIKYERNLARAQKKIHCEAHIQWWNRKWNKTKKYIITLEHILILLHVLLKTTDSKRKKTRKEICWKQKKSLFYYFFLKASEIKWRWLCFFVVAAWWWCGKKYIKLLSFIYQQKNASIWDGFSW